jgi:hypothetical protein
MRAATEEKDFSFLLTSMRDGLQVKGIYLGTWVEL